MFPIRSLALIVALTLSTSVPLTACAQAAPAPEAAPQAAQDTTSYRQIHTDHARWIGPDGYGMACMVYAPNGVDTVPTIPGTPEWHRCEGAAAMYGADNDDEYYWYERQAAQLIADRLDSGQRLEEDWTWVGMPPVVGAFNDALLDQWEAAGRPDASGWLEAYAATTEV